LLFFFNFYHFLDYFFNFIPYHFISFNFLILYDPHSFYCYLFSIYFLIIFFYLVFIPNLVLIVLISICFYTKFSPYCFNFYLFFLLLFWVIRNCSSWFFFIFLLCDNLRKESAYLINYRCKSKLTLKTLKNEEEIKKRRHKLVWMHESRRWLWWCSHTMSLVGHRSRDLSYGSSWSSPPKFIITTIWDTILAYVKELNV